MSIELVMPSNHLILCRSLILPPSIFPNISVFSSESVLCIRWPKYWRSNQSTLKEISPEYSLEGLVLKLKLQYFGHLMQRTDSLEKTLMLGKIEGKRRRGGRGWDGWMVSLTQGTWIWANTGRQFRTGKPGMLHFMGLQGVGHNLVTEQQRLFLIFSSPYLKSYFHKCKYLLWESKTDLRSQLTILRFSFPTPLEILQSFTESPYFPTIPIRDFK